MINKRNGKTTSKIQLAVLYITFFRYFFHLKYRHLPSGIFVFYYSDLRVRDQ